MHGNIHFLFVFFFSFRFQSEREIVDTRDIGTNAHSTAPAKYPFPAPESNSTLQKPSEIFEINADNANQANPANAVMVKCLTYRNT